MRNQLLLLLSAIIVAGCFSAKEEALTEVQQWTTYEIALTSTSAYPNGYTDVTVSATFTNEAGQRYNRPAFWDGDKTWKVRFAPPDDHSVWSWTTQASDVNNSGLDRQTGKFKSTPYTGQNQLLKHGLLKMSPGKRNVVHDDGTPFLVVGDTPWALPYRATKEQVSTYAQDRQNKGFNVALLMSVQPDMKAEGPEARNTPQGFTRGFSDLSDGHINQLQPAYYQYLDTLINILLDHEIVPVYQPVFHGYGWKGLNVLGNVVEPSSPIGGLTPRLAYFKKNRRYKVLPSLLQMIILGCW